MGAGTGGAANAFTWQARPGRVDRNRYLRLTIEGDKKTEWICGCFLTVDDYFKFCQRHNESLKKAVLAQIDELDMTMVVAEGPAGAAEGGAESEAEARAEAQPAQAAGAQGGGAAGGTEA